VQAEIDKRVDARRRRTEGYGQERPRSMKEMQRMNERSQGRQEQIKRADESHAGDAALTSRRLRLGA